MPLKKLLPIAAALLTLGNTGLYAQDQGWYMGVGAGQSKANQSFGCSDLSGDPFFLNANFSCSSKDTSTGAKVFGGYAFNEYIAAEVSYVDLGKFTLSASGASGATPVTVDESAKARGFSVDAVGTWPITPKIGLLGRIGLFRWTLDTSGNATIGGVPSSSNDKPSGTSVDFGVGAKYDFSKSVGVRVEFQRFNSIGNNDTTGKSDVDLLSASLIYSFR